MMQDMLKEEVMLGEFDELLMVRCQWGQVLIGIVGISSRLGPVCHSFLKNSLTMQNKKKISLTWHHAVLAVDLR